MDATARQVAAIIGPRVRRTRRRLDMSQEALADNAQIHRTQMTGIEWGERLPRIDTLIKLAGGLGVSPCELLDGIVWEVRGSQPGRMVEIEHDSYSTKAANAVQGHETRS